MINFSNASFTYENKKNPCLNNANFKINSGKISCFLGKSGSGKTTITKIINKLIPEYIDGNLEGKITLDSKDLSTLNSKDLIGVVGSVFQDPRTQFFTTDTYSELAFACENVGIEKDDIRDTINKISGFLKIKDLMGRKVFELSSGEKQIVAIGSVYTLMPKIMIFDEPSANLDGEALKNFAQILDKLREHNVTVLIVEHRFFYLKELADNLYIVENGSITKKYDKQDIKSLDNKKLNLMGLRSVGLENIDIKNNMLDSKISLEVKELSHVKKNKSIYNNLSFNLKEGEICGLIGHNGAGKTTLLKSICGLEKEKNGEIYFNGQKKSKSKRIKDSYFLSQDCSF